MTINTSTTFTWFWQNVIIPVWNGIQDAIRTVWNWLYSNVILAIQMEIKGLGIIFNWLHDNVIKPVWDGIQGAISTVWNWLSTNVFSPIGKAADAMGKAFQSAQQIIAGAWQQIVDAAKQPVQFIIDTVYNNGIRSVWNSIAGPLGLKTLDPIEMGGGGGSVSAGGSVGNSGAPKAYATGGKVSGPGHGTSDSILARISNGEYIVNARSTAQHLPLLEAINGGGLPGFAGGGLVGDVLGAIGGALNTLKNVALGGIQAAATPLVRGFETLADNIPGAGTGFGKMLDAGVHTLGDGFLAWIGGKDKAANAAKAAAGGSVGSPGAVSGDLAGWVQAAMAAANVAGSNWLNGLETIIMHESGGNPNATNNWDSNAAAGDPSRGLMQTIGSTFEAYRSQALPDDIFDPVANIVAGIGYIKSRYGDISSVPGLVSMAQGGSYVGYDEGGWLEPGITRVINNTGQPERVISPRGAGPAGSALGGGAPELHLHVEIHDNFGMPEQRVIKQLWDEFGKYGATWALPSAGVNVGR